MNDATSAPRNQSSGELDTLESATCVSPQTHDNSGNRAERQPAAPTSRSSYETGIIIRNSYSYDIHLQTFDSSLLTPHSPHLHLGQSYTMGPRRTRTGVRRGRESKMQNSHFPVCPPAAMFPQFHDLGTRLQPDTHDKPDFTDPDAQEPGARTPGAGPGWRAQP
ncbi:hypothetical protein BDP81DRAFT_101885 [Colletotrichum phormii]|uniref:Uncharacterized protein n=1 Tax=Colletotrichum phormii TaxID=359342 RepID=A0AAJ0EA98_9PEZI|nr:uncharacterized protein BDP81DRAFT_101885 [Colletotrichum phormii]KAK1624869.1 hypothetical protein BDP81DRAFT_101885 [Colletotrichum phormii]